MSAGATPDFAGMPPESQPILAEIHQVFGFIPPAMVSLAQDPVSLRAAWLITQAGYVQNTLPRLFKERFLTVMAKFNLTPYSLIVRSCSLRQMGMTGQQILEFLRMKLPPQRLIAEQIRTLSATWVLHSGWASMPEGLDLWILWAVARMTVRKDPGGRCRNAAHDALGDELFNKVVVLSTFAAMQRVWIDAHPDADAMQDGRVMAVHKALLKETPEFAQVWDSARKRSTTRNPGPRERKLLVEIAKQDRIREALRDSERRFRTVVENMPFPVMVYAADGEVVMVNRAWTQQSGWHLRDVPTMGDWFDKGEHDQNRWEPTDVEVLYDWPEPVEEGEYTIHTASGQTRIWDFTTMAIGKLTGGRQGLMRTATDVSERHRLQSALWDTNQRITNILESITDAFIAFDQNGTVTWMNQESARMFGRERESIVGRTLKDVFPGVIDTPIYDRLKSCLEQSRTEHFEAFSPLLGVPLELHAYASVQGLTVYFHDIGERKRMEESLQASNRYLTGVLGSITDGFVVLDREHHVTWMNEKAAQMLRIDRDAAMGKLLEDVLPPNAHADVTRQLAQCMQTCGTLHIEYYSDAARAHVALNAYGWQDGLAVHFRDVSQRKRMEEELRASEQHFRGIFECNMMGMAIAHITTGLIVDANDTYLRILGYTREDLKEGRINWITLTPPDWIDVTREQHERIRNGLRCPYEKEYVRKDGRRIPVMVGGAPLDPEDRDLATIFMIDRTEAKASQRSREEILGLLEAVLQVTPVPINVLDLQGNVIIWNDAATKLFGWTQEEVVGKPMPVVPDDKRETYAKLLERRRAGESLSLSAVPCQTKDGRQLTVDVDLRPVRDSAGKVTALMAVTNCVSLVRQGIKAEPWVDT